METATQRTRKTRAPAPLRIHSLSLTEQDTQALVSLAGAVSDRIGRACSASAIMRALIRLADKDVVPLPTLAEAVEVEVNTGRKWGRTPRSRSSKT